MLHFQIGFWQFLDQRNRSATIYFLSFLVRPRFRRRRHLRCCWGDPHTRRRRRRRRLAVFMDRPLIGFADLSRDIADRFR